MNVFAHINASVCLYVRITLMLPNMKCDLLFPCGTPGNSTTKSCSEADICLQPSQAKDNSLFTEVCVHAKVPAGSRHRPIHTPTVSLLFYAFPYLVIIWCMVSMVRLHKVDLCHCGLTNDLHFWQII